jgi:hypothetical protein
MTSPAASRRLGPTTNSAACFVVRDHNGQALAYVLYERGTIVATSANAACHTGMA